MPCIGNGRKDLTRVAWDEAGRWLVIERGNPSGQVALVVCNFNDTPAHVPVGGPPGAYRLELGTDEPRFAGAGVAAPRATNRARGRRGAGARAPRARGPRVPAGDAVIDDGRARVVVLAVRPEVDGGRYPVKRVARRAARRRGRHRRRRPRRAARRAAAIAAGATRVARDRARARRQRHVARAIHAGAARPPPLHGDRAGSTRSRTWRRGLERKLAGRRRRPRRAARGRAARRGRRRARRADDAVLRGAPRAARHAPVATDRARRGRARRGDGARRRTARARARYPRELEVRRRAAARALLGLVRAVSALDAARRHARHAARRRGAARLHRRARLRRRVPAADPSDRARVPQGTRQHARRAARTIRAARGRSARPRAATRPCTRSSARSPTSTLRRRGARAQGLEVALDIAFQASPDHPWVKRAPEVVRAAARRHDPVRREPAEEVPGRLPVRLRERGLAGAVGRAARRVPVLVRARRARVPRRQPAHQADPVLAVVPRARCRRGIPTRSSSPRRSRAPS